MGRSTLTTSGRPDNKVEGICSIDGQNGLIVYAVPNANKPTYKHLEEVKRNLTNGYIENGVELTKHTFVLYGITFASPNTVLGSAAGSTPDRTIYGDGEIVYVFGNTGVYKGRITDEAQITLIQEHGNVSTDFTDNNATVYEYYKLTKSPYLATQGSQTHTDLIGDPANYPTSLKSVLASGKGVGFMNALLTSDSGTTLIPDGVIDTFKVSKKGITFYNAIRSTDSDTNPSAPTWASFTPTSSTVTNALTLTDEPSGNLVLAQYSSGNQPAIPITTPRPIEVVDRDLIASNHHSVYAYNGLTYAGTGKVATGVSIESKYLEDVLQNENKDIADVPKHKSLVLDSTSIVASKALVAQTSNATQVFTQEMVYNVDWGDTDEFDALTNTTTTNLNGDTVQHKVLLKPSSIKLGA